MEPTEQLGIARRLLRHLEAGTTELMDAVYRQPVREYVDPAHAARERACFFTDSPHCVGLSGLLPGPGSYATHDLLGVPLLLTRDRTGRFRAFLNVCRHRGARVTESAGSAQRFTCPYHAWAYDLEGALVSRPEEASFAGCPRDEHGLTALPAVERRGLLWICPTPGAALDPAAHLDGLEAELASFDLGGFHHYASRDLRRRMNWKLVVDTFLESYHFNVLHRSSIHPIFHPNLATFDHWGPNFRLVSARRSIGSLREQPEADWDLRPHIVGIYVLFPSTVLVWQGEQVELWQVTPDPADPAFAALRLSLYAPTAPVSDSARRHWDRNLELVLHVVENEDFPVGEGIQRGFESKAQEHIVFGRNEPALAHYHRALSATVAAR